MEDIIYIYTTNTIEAERTKEKLHEFGYDIVVKHIVKDGITYMEFKSLLFLTENGVYDLITKKAKNNEKNIEDLKLSELYEEILNNPKLLKTTIITNFEKIGFGLNGVKVFCPAQYRKEEREEIIKNNL